MFTDGMFDIGHVSVSDPVKKTIGLGLNPFIQYNIRTEALSGAVVQRRYNDFYWLYESFISQYPGLIIPVPPEKSAMKKFDEIYIESRRRKLEVFINRICKHQILCKSEYLEVFLLANDAKLASEKTKEKSSRQSTLAWLGQQVAQINPTDMFDYDKRDEVDEKFLRFHTRLKKILEHTSKIADASVLLVKSAANSSLALKQAGIGMSNWAKDDEDTSLASKLSKSGSSLSAISLEIGKYAQAQMESWEEPLLDCVSMLSGAVTAFDRREQARLYYLRCKRETASHVERKTNLTVAGVTNSLMVTKKEAHAKALINEESAKTKLEMISSMLMTEYYEFEQQRLPEIKQLIAYFSKTQAEYYMRLNTVSAEFCRKLEIGGA